MFYTIGLITGLIIGYFLNSFIHTVKKGMTIKIFEYEISISKVRKAEVINIEEKKITVPESKGNKCEICDDEDMFIKGTKSLIPCPECNRNRKKFKKLVL